jgi:hypothetical protein
MFQSKIAPALIALAALALAVPALSAAGNNTTELVAKLKGKYEVPGPGAEKGNATMAVFVKPTQEKLCFNFDVSKLDPMTEAHIHKGAEGVAGPPKVTLFQDTTGLEGTGSYEGCVKKIKSKLLKKIAAKPENFYANIHTFDFPDGAIRGQLSLGASG